MDIRNELRGLTPIDIQTPTLPLTRGRPCIGGTSVCVGCFLFNSLTPQKTVQINSPDKSTSKTSETHTLRELVSVARFHKVNTHMLHAFLSNHTHIEHTQTHTHAAMPIKISGLRALRHMLRKQCLYGRPLHCIVSGISDWNTQFLTHTHTHTPALINTVPSLCPAGWQL